MRMGKCGQKTKPNKHENGQEEKERKSDKLKNEEANEIIESEYVHCAIPFCHTYANNCQMNVFIVWLSFPSTFSAHILLLLQSMMICLGFHVHSNSYARLSQKYNHWTSFFSSCVPFLIYVCAHTAWKSVYYQRFITFPNTIPNNNKNNVIITLKASIESIIDTRFFLRFFFRRIVTMNR